MADNSNIKNKAEELGTFNRIIKDTGEEITKLIPTLGSFFAVFKGAQIASSVKQMADFYQGFKNLSFQMGKSNTMSKEFLKNIYKVKIATGDTLNNLNEITIALVKNRVEGGKALSFLTKQISFFSEATGASVDTSSQLAGELYRIGHLGPKSISSIMTSMLKVQRTVGLTSEEITNLSQNIITTTTELSNLNKSARFIEDFQKGTIKLASAFRTVGIEASRATDIVDRLLDINNLENNMLLYAKMGVSIQDAVAGNIDPNMMAEGLRKVGAEIAGMSRPAGAALARQIGISYREALQFQNLKPTEDIATSDNEMEKMAKEQRTLWTKIERFFNSGIGWIASQFLQNPLMFGGLAFTAFMVFGKKAMNWMKSRFNAIADSFGKSLGNAFDQSYEKSKMKKDIKKNQGLASGKSSGNSLIDKLDASRDRAQKRGITSAVNFERAMNSKTIFLSNYGSSINAIDNKWGELNSRKVYLENENRNKPEQWWAAWQMNRLKRQRSGLKATESAEKAYQDAQYKKALNRLTPEQAGQIYVDAKNARETAFNNMKEMSAKKLALEATQKTTQAALKRAKSDINYAHELPALQEANEKLNKEISDTTQVMSDLKQTYMNSKAKMDEMAGTKKFNPNNPNVALPQHEFWWQRLWGGAVNIKRGVQDRLSDFGHNVKMGAINWAQHPIMNTLGGIWKVLKLGFGLVKKFLLPMGAAMAGMMVVSKIMERFQPLFENLSPVIEGIFDTLATILTPLIKAVMKPILWIAGGIYKAINWVARKVFHMDTGQPIDFNKILTNIDNWKVGQKMDAQAEKEEQENAVVLQKGVNGKWIANNPSNAANYLSGYGLGPQMAQALNTLNEILDTNKTQANTAIKQYDFTVQNDEKERTVAALKGAQGSFQSWFWQGNRPQV